MIMDPASLRKLYRLTLRAISASVLHQTRSVLNIRKLYKPVFREAARAVQWLQPGTVPALAPAEHARLQDALSRWNKDMVNTVELLLSSAHHYGLVDRITRNLSYLQYIYRRDFDARTFQSAGEWDPQRQAAHRNMHIPSSKAVQRAKAQRLIEEKPWEPLSQVIHMAERTAGIHLGRLSYNVELRRRRGQSFHR